MSKRYKVTLAKGGGKTITRLIPVSTHEDGSESGSYGGIAVENGEVTECPEGTKAVDCEEVEA